MLEAGQGLADPRWTVYEAQVESLLFDGANSAVLVRESHSRAALRIALPQTGQYAGLQVGQSLRFGFDPQNAVCFGAPDAR